MHIPIVHPNPYVRVQALSRGGGGAAGAGGEAAKGARLNARSGRRPVRSLRPSAESNSLLHACASCCVHAFAQTMCCARANCSAGAEATDSVHSRGRGAQRECHRVAARTASSC